MAITTINTGQTANDGSGDSIRVAFQKANDNFTFLQGSINDLVANSVVVTAGVRLEGGGFLTGSFKIRSTILDPYYDVATTNQTFGGGTVPGLTTFTNTQDSASVTTGAVVITGGLGVSGTSTLDTITAGNIDVTRGLRISAANAVVATGNVVAANFNLAAGGQITLPSGVPLDADIIANAAAQATSLTALLANAASQHSEIAAKAPIASPTFTGTPAADTATPGTNTTQLATTAFVHEANVGLSNHIAEIYAPIASPTFTGSPAAPTVSASTNSTLIATTACVHDAVANKADLASPAFTGTPSLPTGTTATTQAAGTNSTTLATTAFVHEANVGLANHVAAIYSTIASPTFTGTPAADTATPGTNTTQLATTAFVHEANVGLAAYVDANIGTLRYDASITYAPLANPSFTGTTLATTGNVVAHGGNATVYAGSAPTSSKGAAGDVPGKIFADIGYVYICYGHHDGSTDIWTRTPNTAATWP